MRVKVQRCFGGSERFELVFLHGGRTCREYVRADQWDRAAAVDALDLFQFVYHIDRRSVRFFHH